MKNKIYYFLGIGGIGMSALAQYFHSQKECIVKGYDKTETDLTKKLEHLGMEITFEDSINTIPKEVLESKDSTIVYTPAIPKDHTQKKYLESSGYELFKRSDILGKISENSFCLAVAGTHGKTTTSCILSHLYNQTNQNFTAFLGGITKSNNSNLIQNGTENMIVEADEFDRTFLKLSPDIACITSMDADHLDIYGTHTELKKTFKEFANKVSKYRVIAKGLPIDGYTYAIDDNSADYTIINLKIKEGGYEGDIITPKHTFKKVFINQIGRHNLSNALAAFAMSDLAGIVDKKLCEALGNFQGIERRLSYVYTTNEKIIIDDYAHHPTEIDAIYNTLEEHYKTEKKAVIFQPHLFSRTKDFMDSFGKSLSQFDEVYLLDIYPARELPIKGINSDVLLEKITHKNKDKIEKKDIYEIVKNKTPKIVTLLGAGDIDVEIKKVVKQLG